MKEIEKALTQELISSTLKETLKGSLSHDTNSGRRNFGTSRTCISGDCNHREMCKLGDAESVTLTHGKHYALAGPVTIPESLAEPIDLPATVAEALGQRVARRHAYTVALAFGIPGPLAVLHAFECAPYTDAERIAFSFIKSKPGAKPKPGKTSRANRKSRIR